jgi:ankyrin repeat protein
MNNDRALANLMNCTVSGETTVLMAVHSGSVPVLHYLLDCGVDPALPTSRGSTPLHEAAENGTMILLYVFFFPPC